MAKGAFPRAKVTRGTNWDFGEDDGNKQLCIHVQLLYFDQNMIVDLTQHSLVLLGGDGKTGTVVILKDWSDSSFVSVDVYCIVNHIITILHAYYACRF